MKFDFEIIQWANQFAHQSTAFDSIVEMASTNHLLKGSVFIIMLWYFWFRKESHKDHQEKIILGLTAALITMAVTIVLTRVLPARVRPRFDPEIHFVNPTNQLMTGLQDHSSLPSDHAALFFALSTTIYFLNRRFGIFAYLYTIIIICLPRIYLGLHYPSDLLVGGIIGIMITQTVQRANFFHTTSSWVIRYEREAPATFYSAMFILSYQLANLFEECRAFVKFGVELFQ